jgi:hypothetical protein
MIQVRSTTIEPTDEQLGTMLSAALTGLVSAVFWITFSYGFFKRARQPIATSLTNVTEGHPTTSRSKRPHKKK